MVGPWRSLAFSDLANYYSSNGADKVITLDIHNEALVGCFNPNVNVTNLSAVNLAARYISEVEKINQLVVLSPDEGGVKRAQKFFESYHGAPKNKNNESKFVIMLKKRERPNEVASMVLTGDVEGKDCIIVDDMIDTGGTIIKAVSMLKEKGAKNVYVFATHGIFNDNFYERLEDSQITKVYVSTSLKPPINGAEPHPKVKRIHVEKLLADHIYKNCMSAP